MMTASPEEIDSSQPTVALGVSGGIAAYKAVEVLRGLQRADCSVRVAMTKRACEFVTPLTFRALSGHHVIVDDYSLDNPDPIAHITFSQSVDLLVIAPATANIIAKFAQGIADDFLTSTYLASTAPVLIAPAMNTSMWNHPATVRNIEILRNDGIQIIEPDAGEMACGTIGPGRLSDSDRIVAAALTILTRGGKVTQQDLAGENILITTGSTREEIDPVRFISNRSSGRMGFALAETAKSRGAIVTVVAGVTSVAAPSGITLIKTTSADQMYDEVMDRIGNSSVFIGAAAVADYKPAERASNKLKKTDGNLVIQLERTRDILQAVGTAKKDDQIVIGFAAETDDLLSNARTKLANKSLDAIIANDVSRADAGFDHSHNEVMIISRDRDRPLELPRMTKLEVAQKILDEVVRLRSNRNRLSIKAGASPVRKIQV